MTKFTCLDVMKAAGLEGRRRGKEQAFHCPRHEDEKPSLTVNPDKDVWMCGPCDQDGTAWQLAAFVVGCDPADKEPVKAWLRDRGLLSGNGHREQASQKPTIACTYAYRDAHGVLLYESVRFIPKDFKRRRPDGNGGYVWNLDGVRLIPYALDRLVDRTPDVFVPEGEKDCEALWSRQAPATCNIGGAGKWLDSYSEQLRTVAGVERAYLLRDHDVPGHRHADQVAASLHRVGIEVRIVLLPGLHDGAPAPNHGRDISHWLETHDIAELKTRAAETPPWIPTPEPQTTSHSAGLDPALLDDVTIVVQEGLQIARDGVPYAVDGIVPALGMVGVQVAFSKVGKTTSGQQLGGAAACGTPFLGRVTRPTRVLILAAEDPPEYTAYLARHLTTVPEGQLTFYRHPIQLNTAGLAQIVATVQAGGYGLVLIASWQSVVTTLIRDENDNAGAVRVMEAVKGAARATGIPWLIDAHSGKGEDQRDDADPTRALRGASSAAGSADFILSLRYADGPFGTKRRLSGKGRFVSFAPILLPHNPAHRLGKYLGEDRRVLQTAIDPYTFEESDRFLKRVQQVCPHLYAFFFVALRTGMREGELIELRWTDFPAHRPSEVHVCRSFSLAQAKKDRQANLPPAARGITTPKSRRDRYEDCSSQVLAVLKAERIAQRARAFKNGRPVPELCFTSKRGTRLDPHYVLHRLVPRICTTELDGVAPVRVITIHGLRHTYVTQMLLKGGMRALPYIGQQIGHRDPSTTEKHYGHWLAEHRDEVLANRLDEPPVRLVEDL